MLRLNASELKARLPGKLKRYFASLFPIREVAVHARFGLTS